MCSSRTTLSPHSLPGPFSFSPPSSKLRRPPVAGEGRDDERWYAVGRVVEEFRMDQPIMPYMFMFVVGEIVSREVRPWTRVYAEDSLVLEAAAVEFMEIEVMTRQGEKLFGEYEWERFDLPPSFPYGGMENQRMVFLTPEMEAAHK